MKFNLQICLVMILHLLIQSCSAQIESKKVDRKKKDSASDEELETEPDDQEPASENAEEQTEKKNEDEQEEDVVEKEEEEPAKIETENQEVPQFQNYSKRPYSGILGLHEEIEVQIRWDQNVVLSEPYPYFKVFIGDTILTLNYKPGDEKNLSSFKGIVHKDLVSDYDGIKISPVNFPIDALVPKLDVPDLKISIPFMGQLGQSFSLNDASATDKEACLGLASDNLGNVYCAGYTYGSLADNNAGSSDVFIAKIDQLGTVSAAYQVGLDTRTSVSTAVDEDRCVDIAIDSQNNIYCVGDTNGNFGSYSGNSTARDVAIVKFSPTGEYLWSYNFPIGPSSTKEYFTSIVIDSNDNLICSGYTNDDAGEINGGFEDAMVLKLDSNGNIIWKSQLGSVTTAPGGNNAESDRCMSVAIDSQDNIYCGGDTESDMADVNAGFDDAFVWKMDKDGNLIWITQLGQNTKMPGMSHSGLESCLSIEVDSADHVYCGGWTSSSMGEVKGGAYDIFLSKISKDGDLLWVSQIGDESEPSEGAADSSEKCADIAVDSQDNIYCAGSTSGSLGETNGGDSDVIFVKWNAAGERQWIKQLGSESMGTASSASEVCSAIEVDLYDQVYCAGYTTGDFTDQNAGNYDAIYIKLDVNGQIN